MEIGILILAGGKSRRMGFPKSSLEINGISFLRKLYTELHGFREFLVSVDSISAHPEISFPMVEDIYPDHGPMGGIYSALKVCESDALLVVPCDVPLFTRQLAGKLCDFWKKESSGTELSARDTGMNDKVVLDKKKYFADVVLSVTEDGRKHPLCGIYRKSCLPVLKETLEGMDFRMTAALDRLNVRDYFVGDLSWQLANINTVDEYRRLSRKSFLAICGYKNSGKTTLIERLIPLLRNAGLSVSVIKHDGHSFVPDVPGTDSYRFFHAGADVSIAYDGEKYSITRKGNFETDLECFYETEQLSVLLGTADLCLIEGCKTSDFPKLEVVRKESGNLPIKNLSHRLAYITDDIAWEKFEKDIPRFSMREIPLIADYILTLWRKGELKK